MPIERSSGGGGGGGLTSPLTTKGDVWGWSTTNARIPVGTDTQVLTANSAATLGVDYEYPPGHVFDYVTRSTDLTLTAVETDWITGNSVTYDGATLVRIECFCAAVDESGSANTMLALVRLYDGVSAVNRIFDERGTNTFQTTALGVVYLTPTAGAHTFKVTAVSGGVGTVILHGGTVGGGSGTYGPPYLRITKA
jgi:hypothetical protein